MNDESSPAAIQQALPIHDKASTSSNVVVDPAGVADANILPAHDKIDWDADSERTPLAYPANLGSDSAAASGDDPFADIDQGPAKFEGAEHQSVADGIKLYDVNGNALAASKHIISTAKNVELRFGRLISLAGDFFTNRQPGTPTDYAPICGAFFNVPTDKASIEQRFMNMVTSLENDINGCLKLIVDVLDRETRATRQSLESGGQVARSYHQHDCGMPDDADFVKATGGGSAFGYLQVTPSSTKLFASGQLTSRNDSKITELSAG